MSENEENAETSSLYDKYFFAIWYLAGLACSSAIYLPAAIGTAGDEPAKAFAYLFYCFFAALPFAMCLCGVTFFIRIIVFELVDSVRERSFSSFFAAAWIAIGLLAFIFSLYGVPGG